MTRLPTPGSDNGTWGDILNDFLRVEHSADGSLKPIPQSKITNLTGDLADLTSALDDRVTEAQAAAAYQPLAARLTTLTGRTDTTEAAALRTAALDGVYSPLGGSRVAVIGDSIPSGGSAAIGVNGSVIEATADKDWMAWTCAAMGGGFHYIKNAGIGSNSPASQAARFATDVIAYHPDVVVLGGATWGSGLSQSIDVAATPHIRSMVAATRAIGAKVVICNAWPSSTSGSGRVFVDKLNLWIARYCAQEGIPMIDQFSAVVDPATGAPQAGLTFDGLHPNTALAKVIGDLAALTLAKVITPWKPPLPGHQTVDSSNLFANGLFLTDTNTDGLVDGWAKTGNATATNPTPGGTVLGKAQRVNETNTSQAFASMSISAGFSPGDMIAIVGRVTAVMGTSIGPWTMQLNFTGSAAPNSIRPFSAWTCDVTDHVFYREAVIPPGTTALAVLLSRMMTTAGNGTLTLSQFGVYNLTTGGVLAA